MEGRPSWSKFGSYEIEVKQFETFMVHHQNLQNKNKMARVRNGSILDLQNKGKAKKKNPYRFITKICKAKVKGKNHGLNLGVAK
jgi:hypothetical protein